jgi:hypothetical protein
MLPCG